MADEMIFQTFLNKSDDYAEFRAARAEDRAAALHRELAMAEVTPTSGCPSRPRIGADRAPRGHVRRHARVFVTGAGTGLGQGDRRRVRAPRRRDRHREPQARAPRRRARRRSRRSARRVLAVACDIREPDQIAPAFDAAEQAFGLPDVLVNNAAANFPAPAEDLSPNAWRTVVDITLNGTFFCAREFARRHLVAGTPGSIVNVGACYAWTGGPGFAHSAAAKAGRQEHGRDPRRRVGALRDPGQRARAGAVPARGHDRRHPFATSTARATRTAASPRCGSVACRELGWAATFLASPYARFISGHTLVVDGANWQRRSMTNPTVVTIRDQMGRGPFDPDAKR